MLNLSSGEQISARVLVGAEGAQSVIQQQLKICRSGSTILRSAVITTLEVDQPVQYRAWEHLPERGRWLYCHWASVLIRWSGAALLLWQPGNNAIITISAFIRQLQQAFGFPCRLLPEYRGKERCTRFLCVILHRQHITGPYCWAMPHINCILSLDKGFNLAMRDIMVLQQVLQETADPGNILSAELPATT